MKTQAFFYTLLNCLILSALADSGVPTSRYSTVRSTALGDALVPLSDDSSALFYNPAGIAKIRHTTLEPNNITVSVNKNLYDVADKDIIKAYDLGAWEPSLSTDTRRGKFPRISGTYFPNFQTRGFAFGILGSSSVAASALTNETDIRYRTQYLIVPTAGTALRLASGVVKLGYTFQYVSKSVGDITVPRTNTLGYGLNLSEGAALSHNLGLSVTIPWTYLPQATVVVRNVGGAKYTLSSLVALASSTVGKPANEVQSMDVGFSMSPKIGMGAKFNLSATYRDMTNTSGTSLIMKPAIGAEFSFRDYFFLRAGYLEGYPSFGFGIDRKKGEFGLSWYNVEIGNSYLSKSDQRFMFQYALRAF